ncbi:MAG: SGNH/GDSL hydrolase family protein [Oscillospiraceae bacterium]|nr:SGNH/GDSL hydrolase family protein [Oscillospiraceae bacterium]
MKKILSAVLAAAMLLTLAGCNGAAPNETPSTSTDNTSTDISSDNGSSSDSGDTDTDTPSDSESEPEDSEIDYSKLSGEEIYELMVKRSLMTTGDMTRMANVLKKAENGGEITVSYIGGSITEGLTVAPSHPELCWANLSYEWLCGKYPNAKINYVNAGLSGTPSILGNVRLERDILAHDPDICFVEFAVNDGNANEYKVAYESLVRTLLTQDKDIAVVLLFTVLKNGHSCQPHMSEIGNNYGLPMISEPDSLGVEFAEGRMTWEDYSDDESHPSERGHEIVRDFVAYYFEQVMAAVDENTGTVDKTLPAPVFSERYVDMHYIDNAELKPELVGFEENDAHSAFHNGWMYKGKEDASIKFTINCKSLQMIFLANNSKAYGMADIYIDGEIKDHANANMADGWNNPVTILVIDEDTVSEHTVEIKLPGGTNHYFAVLGFGYCD